jgi:hypothetical protein
VKQWLKKKLDRLRKLSWKEWRVELPCILVWPIIAILLIPFRHLFDVDIMAAISALLMMPEIVLEWVQAIDLSWFMWNFTLPLAVLVLFIIIVVKLRQPEKGD